MSVKLSTFKHKLQDHIRLDDREWNYAVPNLPGPDKLDNSRLIKTVSLVMTSGKYEINLTLGQSPRELSHPRRATQQVFSCPSLSSAPRLVLHQLHPQKTLSNHRSLGNVSNMRRDSSKLASRSRAYGTIFMDTATVSSNPALASCMPALQGNIPQGKFARRLYQDENSRQKSQTNGLLFSTSAVAMTIHPDRIEDIPDIEIPDYIFTDGCGLIPLSSHQSSHSATELSFENRRYTPSVFQIRYRGYKGVVEVDPTMPRPNNNSSSTPPVLLKLRKSMKKFSGGDDYSFSVVEYSKPNTYAYVNDESILLSSALGIAHETFHQKQNDHFQFLEEATRDPRAAFKFLSYVDMPELAEKVLMEDNLDRVQSKIKALVKAEYGKMLNKRDEQKCRILIPQSRLLFGV